MMRENVAGPARKGTERLGRLLGDARGGVAEEIQAKNGGTWTSRRRRYWSVLYLGLQCLGEHPPGSLASDLVEVEHCLFMDLLILM